MVHGLGGDDQNYTSTVRSNGLIIKKWDSKISKTNGDKPGTGLGLLSQTVGDVVEPTSRSTIVKAQGQYVIRHRDTCTLNNGNCPGEYIHVKSTDVHKAPDGNDEDDKRPWYKRGYDWTNRKLGEAGKAISDFDQAHGKVITRTVGGLQAVGGVVEMAAGGTLVGGGGAASATGVGAAPGIPAMIGGAALWVNGADNAQAGWRQMWSGESTPTMIAQASGQAATALGASPETAQTIENTVGMAQGIAGGTGTAAAAMRTGTKLPAAAGKGAATTADDAARAAAKEADEVAKKAAQTSGQPGARSTRVFKSLRDRYLGRTPGKNSRTGKEVRERMREEGTLRTNRKGQDEFLDEKGTWRPVDSPQTHMGHYPVDAVDYWNNTGRYLGERSPAVRDWMLDSNNYRFEWGPFNSARGGATTSRYLPPAN